MTADSADAASDDVRFPIRDSARVVAAVSRAQGEAVRRRLLLGHPFLVWRDGKVVEVWPSDPEAQALLAEDR